MEIAIPYLDPHPPPPTPGMENFPFFIFFTWMASLSPELRTQSGVRPVV